jgi:MFS family permease
MMLSDIFVVASCLLMIRNLSVGNLCVSRFLVGISCGISSSVIPPFLISLSPPEWRNIVGSMHQVFVAGGVGFSFYLGQRLPQLALLGITNWQSYLFLPVLYACTRIIALLFFRYSSNNPASIIWRAIMRVETRSSYASSCASSTTE